MLINNQKKFTDFFTKSVSRREVDFLVLHHVRASSFDDAVSQFLKHQVSSHFLIDEQGKIHQLVDENDIAYHAGVSFWRGFTGLNKNSIGIELINSEPFSQKFSSAQMLALVDLAKHLMQKYSIDKKNILGHSDIAYYEKNSLVDATLKPVESQFIGFLDRKQDPSHLFDWRFLAQNGIGIFPEINFDFAKDVVLFELGAVDSRIAEIKQKLAGFGYKVLNFNDEFNLEMQNLTRVFHRRFNQQKFFDGNSDAWYQSSQRVLDKL